MHTGMHRGHYTPVHSGKYILAPLYYCYYDVIAFLVGLNSADSMKHFKSVIVNVRLSSLT